VSELWRDVARVPVWVGAKALYASAPVPWLFRLATFRGTVDSLVSPRRKQVIAALECNLGGERSPREIRTIARRFFQYRRRAAMALLWPQIRGFAGAEQITVDGLEHLDAALARGQGAILVTAHFGYGHLIKPILRSRGRNVTLVGRMPGDRPNDARREVSRFGSAVRDRLLRLPTRSPDAAAWRAISGPDLPTSLNLRPHLAALARNEAVIVLADGRAAHALRRLPVLGMDVEFSSGALSIARATGVDALPVFVVDCPDGTGLRLVVHPPLELQRTQDPSADLVENLSRFADVWTREAQANPHHWRWTWVHGSSFR
jgi:KDO2-lipid IV(A) lauroyltransferase